MSNQSERDQLWINTQADKIATLQRQLTAAEEAREKALSDNRYLLTRLGTAERSIERLKKNQADAVEALAICHQGGQVVLKDLKGFERLEAKLTATLKVVEAARNFVCVRKTHSLDFTQAVAEDGLETELSRFDAASTSWAALEAENEQDD